MRFLCLFFLHMVPCEEIGIHIIDWISYTSIDLTMIHHHSHHHHRRRRHSHRRFSPIGFLFPLIFFGIFVSRSVFSYGMIFPIVILIVIISIISSAVRNSSRRQSSEQSSRGYYPNRNTYKPHSSPNQYSDYSDYSESNHFQSNNHPSSIKAKLICSSCNIELDSNSKDALDENGFVYCGFCGNKIIN